MNEIDEVEDKWKNFYAARVKRRTDLTSAYIRYVERLSKLNFPPIFELSHLAELIGIELAAIAKLIARPDLNYRTFEIPKRRGGMRIIDVPSPDLLFAQRWILRNIISNIPLNDAAHGFVVDRSIISNANVHVDQKCILKIDIQDFFPSISQKRGVSIFRRIGYPRNVSYFLSALCFKDGCLPQGAATSPSISNIVAKRMDKRLMSLAQKHTLRYTRYADDMVFSGDQINPSLLGIIEGIISNEGFQINRNKTQFIGPMKKKIVTGISITNGKLALPRESIRSIKQEAHFLIKYGYMSYLERSSVKDPILIERLLGKIAFWLQISPDNTTAMRLFQEVKKLSSDLTIQMNEELTLR